MKKSIKMLIGAIVVLLILGAVYYFAVKWEPGSDEKNDDTHQGTVYVTDFNLEDIDFIEFNGDSFSYSLKSEDGTAKISGYASAVISESMLSSQLSSSLHILADREIEKKEAGLSEYGLEGKTKFLTYHLKDGTTETVVIGSDALISNSIYVLRESDKKIFTVSSYTVDSILRAPEEFRDMTVCTIDNTSITAVNLSRGNKEIMRIVKKDDEKTDENQIMTQYMLTYPSSVKASSDRVHEIIEKLGPINADDIAEENPSDLNKYGLSSPLTLTVTDSGGEHKIMVGNKTDSYYYMMYNDVPVVYEAPCSFYELLIQAEAKDYFEKFVHLFDITKVKEIDLLYKGETHTFTIANASEDNAEYTIDGKKISEDKFKKIYQAVIGITFNDIVDFTPTVPSAVITFKFNDGSSKDYVYYPYNERYVCVKADNGMHCITLEKNLEEIINSLSAE